MNIVSAFKVTMNNLIFGIFQNQYMNTYLLIENATKSYGDILLFDNISILINEKQKIALVGRNGSGKTTLLNIISGFDNLDQGNFYINKNIKTGYLRQDPQFNPELTVFQAVYGSQSELVKIVRDYEIALHSTDNSKLDGAISKMDFHNAWDIDLKIKQMLTILKLDNLEQPVAFLSGGQVKRLGLAVALINDPDFLILDEPTNHLDLEMIEWLEEYLIKSQITLLMVTHDRYFLDRICNEIIEIDEKLTFSYKGNYSYYLQKREERILNKNLQVDKAQNILRKELEWMRRMPKARSTKSKSRIDAFYNLKETADYKRADKIVDINIKHTRLGNKILELEHVYKKFGDLVILNDFTYIFSRFEKIGIIGANGVGKSTFLNLLTSQVIPDNGTIDAGETVNFGYYEQKGINFRPQQRLIDIVKDIAEVVTLGDGRQIPVSQFLIHFLFPPEMHYVQVEKLSGGEKRRLYLMTVLMRNPNFLILDEPTNDLDIITLNVLEDYLSNFRGCLIIVSHDRFFMDKLVDHLFIFEGNGEIFDFPGNYSDYRSSVKKQESESKKLYVAEKPKPLEIAPTIKNKLSYKEKKELEMIEQELEKLESEKSSLEIEISNSNLNQKELYTKSNRIGELIVEIDKITNRWLELNN